MRSAQGKLLKMRLGELRDFDDLRDLRDGVRDGMRRLPKDSSGPDHLGWLLLILAGVVLGWVMAIAWASHHLGWLGWLN
jgi:hypothetical protein